jgi:hypothetical protein
MQGEPTSLSVDCVRELGAPWGHWEHTIEALQL